jgi:hypothetical protein
VLKGSTGSQTSVYLAQLTPSGFSSWKPSPIYSYAVWLNQSWLYGTSNTVSAQLTFNVQGTGGTWNIDDVYVDPFKLT